MKKNKNGVRAVGIAYRCFILEFLLDFRKDNLVILVIRYLFPYQGLVIPNYPKKKRTSYSLLRINVFETYEIWILGDPWINILRVISSLI